MDNPSNTKPLRLRVVPPKSHKHEDQVSLTSLKGNAVIADKYSMPLIEEAIEEDLSVSAGTKAEGLERPRHLTCDVCHKSFGSVKAVQGHQRMHPKKPAQNKRAIDERRHPLNSSKKAKLRDSRGEIENRERKTKKLHEDLPREDAVRVSSNINMFLGTRTGGEHTPNQNWSTNHDELGGDEAVIGALILVDMKHSMDWVKYTDQRLRTEGNVTSSSKAKSAFKIWVRNDQRRSTGSTQIPDSSVKSPIDAESTKGKDTSNDINPCTRDSSPQIHTAKERTLMQIIPYVGTSSTQVPNSSQIPVENVRSMEVAPFTGNSSAQIPTRYGSCNQKEKGKAIMTESSKGKRNHVCRVCDMSFSSHHALGGHMTGHNGNKHKGGGEGRAHKKKNEKKQHVCKVCGAVYPTGHQLGGHMSRHFNRNKGRKPIGESSSVNAKVAEEDVGDGGIEQAPVRVELGFDLNEVPIHMEEDGDQAIVT